MADNQDKKIFVDFLLVGQGIAGTVLGYSLIKSGKSIHIIDKKSPNSASRVAAGLYNPVVFKLFTKSWKIDEALPFADKFYREFETFVSDTFYHKKRVHKVFGAVEEREQWEKKKDKPEMHPYINPELLMPFDESKVNQPFGTAAVEGAGYLEVVKMIDLFKANLEKNNCITDSDFDYSNLHIETEGIEYENIVAKKIIFCEGYKVHNNPFFSWLPFKSTKGEVLTIHAPGLRVDETLNRGVFMLPLGDDKYRVGATYNWDIIDEQTTEKAKTELLEKLNKIIKVDYTIVDHKAGVRPTVKDRRPIVGAHPIHESLVVFNGLGTKGVQLAPYFANEMVNLLLHNKPVDPEADIRRFYKHFTE